MTDERMRNLNHLGPWLDTDGQPLWLVATGEWKTAHLFRDGVTPHRTLCGRTVRGSSLSTAGPLLPRCGQCATRRVAQAERLTEDAPAAVPSGEKTP